MRIRNLLVMLPVLLLVMVNLTTIHRTSKQPESLAWFDRVGPKLNANRASSASSAKLSGGSSLDVDVYEDQPHTNRQLTVEQNSEEELREWLSEEQKPVTELDADYEAMTLGTSDVKGEEGLLREVVEGGSRKVAADGAHSSTRWTMKAKRVKSTMQVRDLELNPAKRSLGLPLKSSQWDAKGTFVISPDPKSLAYTVPLLELDGLLHSLGMKYTRICTPKNFSGSTLARYHPIFPQDGPQLHQHLLKYAVAHLEVWAHMVANQIPYGLIFEDDFSASLEPDLWQYYFEEALRQLNLAGIQSGEPFAFDLFLLARQALLPFAESKVTFNIKRARASRGTHAYIVSLRGARKLLRSIRIDRPVNEALWRVKGLHVLALDPPIGITHMYRCARRSKVPCRDMFARRRSVIPWLLACKGSFSADQLPQSKADGKFIRLWWKRQGQMRQGTKLEPGGVLLAKGCAASPQCVFQNAAAIVEPESAQKLQLKGWGNGTWPLATQLENWPVFIVSMAGDEERFEELKMRMEGHGFGEITRALAVDVRAKDFDPAMFRHIITPDHRSRIRDEFWKEGRPFLSLGEVGCGLSHYMVWSEIAAAQLPAAIVFEDDVEFDATFSANFSALISEANMILQQSAPGGAGVDSPQPCDVLLLSTIQDLVNDWYKPQLSRHILDASHAMSWSTYAYIITLDGVRKLLQNFLLDDPLDAVWWRVPGMHHWVAQPVIVRHWTGNEGKQEVKSTITDNKERGLHEDELADWF